MAFVNIPHFLSVDKSQNFYIWAAKNVKMVDSSIDPKIAKFDFTQNLRGTNLNISTLWSVDIPQLLLSVIGK